MQNSGPRDTWLPVVKNSRLFAQRGHSAQCAPHGFLLMSVCACGCEFHTLLARRAGLLGPLGGGAGGRKPLFVFFFERETTTFGLHM